MAVAIRDLGIGEIAGWRGMAGAGEKRGLAVLTVNLGDTVRMSMTIENSTGLAVTKDLLAVYGTISGSTMTPSFMAVSRSVSIPTGSSTKNVDCKASVAGTDFDACGAVGTYNATTGDFTVESILCKLDQLTVAGVGVTGFTLSKV